MKGEEVIMKRRVLSILVAFAIGCSVLVATSVDAQAAGRTKHTTGESKGVHRRGEGLGTGPVGRQDGYAGRKNY